MIEILIILAVGRGFCSIAERKGRSQLVWGGVGVLCYYLPSLAMSFLILPLLLEMGVVHLNLDNPDVASLVKFLITFATGILCCVCGYFVLGSLPAVMEETRVRSVFEPRPRQPLREKKADDNNPYRSST